MMMGISFHFDFIEVKRCCMEPTLKRVIYLSQFFITACIWLYCNLVIGTINNISVIPWWSVLLVEKTTTCPKSLTNFIN